MDASALSNEPPPVNRAVEASGIQTYTRVPVTAPNTLHQNLMRKIRRHCWRGVKFWRHCWCIAYRRDWHVVAPHTSPRPPSPPVDRPALSIIIYPQRLFLSRFSACRHCLHSAVTTTVCVLTLAPPSRIFTSGSRFCPSYARPLVLHRLPSPPPRSSLPLRASHGSATGAAGADARGAA